MRTIILIGCVLAAFLPAGSMAASLGMPEPQAMVYYQIPLGARRTQSQHRFGFRVDEIFLTSNQPADFSNYMGRPAAFELQMGYHGVRTLSVGGLDYMQKYRASRQNDQGGDAAGSDDAPATDTGSETGGNAGEQQSTTAQTEPAKPTRSIQKILDDTEPGWLIGAAIGILILSGVAD